MVAVSHPVTAESFSSDEAEALIAQGASVNAPMPEGKHLLHHAAVWGNIGVAAVLLCNGADVTGGNRTKSTPLHIAAMNGHLGLVELFCKQGADINAKNEFGNTPLHVSVIPAQAKDARVPELLVRLGANPALKNRDGDTPLGAFQRHTEILIGLPPTGLETQEVRDAQDRELREGVHRFSLLFKNR